MKDAIKIRPLTTLAEMGVVEKIQKIIWNIPDLEALPVHTLHAIQQNGGALFGAFDGDKIVGFVLGILGTIQGPEWAGPAVERLKMYSVVAGALPEYQGRGIGYQLKRAQRAFALDIGLDLITWTYDPLESLNGRFNLGKLGATCHTYLRHHHGELGGINAGLPTDRFEVEWRIAGDRVKHYMAGEKRPSSRDRLISQGAVLVNATRFNSDDLPVPPAQPRIPPGDLMLVEIPVNFQAIKQQDFDLALRWRQHSRQVFEALFHDGFIVTDFVYHRSPTGRRRSYYLLTSRNA